MEGSRPDRVQLQARLVSRRPKGLAGRQSVPGNVARRPPRHGGSHRPRAPSYSTVLIKISRVDIQVCRASPSIRAAIDTVAIIGDGSDQLYACRPRGRARRSWGLTKSSSTAAPPPASPHASARAVSA